MLGCKVKWLCIFNYVIVSVAQYVFVQVHFTMDSLVNQSQFNSSFANRLLQKDFYSNSAAEIKQVSILALMDPSS